MLIGYMRVSKADGSQATDLQRDALVAAGVDPAHLYEDQASGKREDRPGLASCLKALRPGDTLVVWKLDRLGRDLRHLINTVLDLTGRGIGLKVLTGHGAAIDRRRQAGLRYLRRAGRVRARVDRRAHRGGPGLSTGTRPERRPAVQDDRRQAAAGDGGNGAVRDQGRRPVPGTWHHAADPVSAYFTQGRATSRWREATQPNLMPT